MQHQNDTQLRQWAMLPGELGKLLALMHELDHNGLASLLDPLRKR